MAQSAAEYTDCISAEEYDPPNECPVAQSAAEYTDCISAEEQDSSNEYTWYDPKQSDDEVSVMLKLWGVWSTPSLPLLPVSLWS